MPPATNDSRSSRPHPPRSGRPVPVARRLVFSLAILAGFLAAAEGVTRLVWQGPEVDRTMPADPRLRWGLDPGGEMVVDGVANRINSRGYRGPEFQVEKPPCTLRIYSAGDSSAFGHGVPDGEAFVERLPGLLAERGVTDLTVEPINGAVPGYSTYQSLERLDQDGWALAPDLLLISNVWSDAGPAVVPDAEFYEEDPGPGERFPQPPPPPLQRSRFVQWAHGWLRPAQPTHDTQTPTGDFRRVSTAGYARNLGRMFDGARERGVVPVMVVLPFSTDRDDLLAGPPPGRAPVAPRSALRRPGLPGSGAAGRRRRGGAAGGPGPRVPGRRRRGPVPGRPPPGPPGPRPHRPDRGRRDRGPPRIARHGPGPLCGRGHVSRRGRIRA